MLRKRGMSISPLRNAFQAESMQIICFNVSLTFFCYLFRIKLNDSSFFFSLPSIKSFFTLCM